MPPCHSSAPIFQIDAAQRPQAGEPFALRHALGGHELFAKARLSQLADKMPASDYFVSYPAQNAKTPFYDTLPAGVSAREVVDGIERGIHKLLLKRPENHDANFRALLDQCLSEALDLVEIRRSDVVRADSFIFVTGRDAITPLHFDPEYGFFMQIVGRKTYNLWSPNDVDTDHLERHYARQVVDVGKVSVDNPDAAESGGRTRAGRRAPPAARLAALGEDPQRGVDLLLDCVRDRGKPRSRPHLRVQPARPQIGGKPGRPGESAIAIK